MKSPIMKLFLLVLLIIGVLMVVFSEAIVFSWIESIIGIEAIVGSENVVYFKDGSYVFSNPRAMVIWRGGCFPDRHSLGVDERRDNVLLMAKS